MFIQRRINVAATSWCWIDINTPLYKCHVAGHMTFIQRINVTATSWRCIDVNATLYKSHVLVVESRGIKQMSHTFWQVCPLQNVSKISRKRRNNEAQPSLGIGHPHNLIKVFTGHPVNSQRSKTSSGGQQRLWSVCADAQTDLSLRWTHMQFR